MGRLSGGQIFWVQKKEWKNARHPGMNYEFIASFVLRERKVSFQLKNLGIE